MPGEQLLLERRQLHLQGANLMREAGGDALGQLRHIGRVAVHQLLRQCQRMVQPSRHLDPELGEQPADHVDELGALLDQQIARPVQRQRRLLIG